MRRTLTQLLARAGAEAPAPPTPRRVAAEALLVLLLACALVWPLFKIKYADAWGSIESTFIADARMLRESGFAPQWQPNWYCGTRWDYIYPPLLRYGTALVAGIPQVIPARAYHLYTAALYALGIVGVYLFVRATGRRRGWSALAAAVAATLSPAFLFIANMRLDAGFSYWSPQRLNALVKYGEGPHISALALLPCALACAWLALERRSLAWLAGAALLSAAVVGHNFYGATALGLFFPLLVWAHWLAARRWHVWAYAAGIAALAYALSAWWFSPSFLRLTLLNLASLPDPAQPRMQLAALAALALFAGVSWALARRRPPEAWTVFVAGAAYLLSIVVLTNHYLHLRAVGDPTRLTPELDFALILLAVWALERLAARGARGRLAAVAAVVVMLALASSYLRHPWAIFRSGGSPEQRVEHAVARYLAENAPGARTMASGSTRFWFNAWHTLAQLDGGSQQGALNQRLVDAQGQIFSGEDPAIAIQWLQALGTDFVAVHGPQSQEIYHDFANARKFAGVLEPAWQGGPGDTLYRVPRRWPERARVVGVEASRAIPAVARHDNSDGALTRYVELVENGPARRVKVTRVRNEEVLLEAHLEAGEAITFQETYDPAWRAYAGAVNVPIEADAVSFMRILPPPGDVAVTLRFATPPEKRAGRFLSAAALLGACGLLVKGRRRG